MEVKDYVDLETAKKLYDLGIKIPSNSFYGDRLYTFETIVKEEDLSEGDIFRPTLYDIQKYLRDKRYIHIEISCLNGNWSFDSYKLSNDIQICDGNGKTYEDALLNGIKETLKYLIWKK